MYMYIVRQLFMYVYLFNISVPIGTNCFNFSFVTNFTSIITIKTLIIVNNFKIRANISPKGQTNILIDLQDSSLTSNGAQLSNLSYNAKA